MLETADVKHIVKDFCEEAGVLTGLLESLSKSDQIKFNGIKSALSLCANQYDDPILQVSQSD